MEISSVAKTSGTEENSATMFVALVPACTKWARVAPVGRAASYKVPQVIACSHRNGPVLAPRGSEQGGGRNEKLDKKRLMQGDAQRHQ
jgi:hypothetical protein